MPKRPEKKVTERAKPESLTRPAGKEQPVKAARTYPNDVVGEVADTLPRFLIASDIASLLHVSKTESYRIASACGATRVGNRKRLVRVARGRFLKYLAEESA